MHPRLHSFFLLNQSVDFDQTCILGERVDKFFGDLDLIFEGTPALKCQIMSNILNAMMDFGQTKYIVSLCHNNGLIIVEFGDFLEGLQDKFGLYLDIKSRNLCVRK